MKVTKYFKNKIISFNLRYFKNKKINLLLFYYNNIEQSKKKNLINVFKEPTFKHRVIKIFIS